VQLLPNSRQKPCSGCWISQISPGSRKYHHLVEREGALLKGHFPSAPPDTKSNEVKNGGQAFNQIDAAMVRDVLGKAANRSVIANPSFKLAVLNGSSPPLSRREETTAQLELNPRCCFE